MVVAMVGVVGATVGVEVGVAWEGEEGEADQPVGEAVLECTPRKRSLL
jgi:hypothetical protein